MKKILLSIFTIATMAISIFGQAPEGFKYQAVVRDASNAILANQPVGIQLTIQQGSAGGTAVYTEMFSPTTNSYGLVNLEIGTGTTTDDFTTIDWSNGTYFIETAIDVAGGTNYSVMGTSQLMSVPYALYAKTSGNGAGPQGPAGQDGTNGADGAPGPAGADGTNGIDGTNGADGATGPAGADGTNGADGAPGPAGADGTNGIDGTNGADGAPGPAGADGTNGADGAPGPAGADGTNGADGAPGPAGNDGAAGATGPQGNDGAAGATGPQGPQGNDGTAGATGPQGPQGNDGTAGATGPQGPQGNDGAAGATGPQGPQGNDGTAGATGPQGPQGNDGTAGATGPQGPQGNDGTAGTSVQITGTLSNVVDLNNISSVLGNGYIIGSDLYVCVSTTNGDFNDYSNVGQIQGPAGATGPQGNDGAAGATGPQGPQGNDGAAGATGPQGPQGNDGAAGATGPQGPQGNDGTAGATGPQGPQGNDGAAGATGPQGPQGNDGAAGATGPQGPQGNDGTAGATGPQGPQGNDGAAGATGPAGGYITHSVGESYGGGIVFYVYDGGQHGLIAATSNQVGSTNWYAGSNSTTLSEGDGINAGKANTSIIISSQGIGDGNTYAARISNEYSVTVNGVTYGDWYLPSKHELELLYIQRVVVGNFGTTTYWSSTENNNTTAHKQAFGTGNQFAGQKSSNSAVRSIRAF